MKPAGADWVRELNEDMAWNIGPPLVRHHPGAPTEATASDNCSSRKQIGGSANMMRKLPMHLSARCGRVPAVRQKLVVARCQAETGNGQFE
jgi:hypothetical protein